MAKIRRIYWDANAWLGLLNREAEKHRELSIIYDAARRRECELFTSALGYAEVYKLRTEDGDEKPLTEENLKSIEDVFRQDFVTPVNLDMIVGIAARRYLRNFARLKKPNDAIHLASAVRIKADALHTYDKSDLLHLNGKIELPNGQKLQICVPDESTDGPLFAQAKERNIGKPG